MACGASNAGKAAKEAGYSDSSEAAKVSAHRLMHNGVVLEAIQEASRKVLIGLAPKAIAAAQRILDDPKHSAHARILETILDRTGFFAETKHNVAVQHSVDTSELEALARRLAAENGIDVRRLLGGPSCDPGEPRRGNEPDAGNQGRAVQIGPLIDGEVVSHETSEG